MEHRRRGYEIRQEFRDLGSQGGQPITTVQLETALKRRNWVITQTKVKAMVRFADQNGDSTVTLFEFARLRHMLDALDHSKTRRLNASDLRIELDSLGLEATDEKIKQMLEVAGVAEELGLEGVDSCTGLVARMYAAGGCDALLAGHGHVSDRCCKTCQGPAPELR